VVNGHSFIVIDEMAALVRHAIAEVCTVPVLLVLRIVVMLLVTSRNVLSAEPG